MILRPVRPEVRQSVRPGRVAAVMEFGFTERQARFLVHVLVFSGVFLERQYRAFTGLVHGQKTHDFLAKLVDNRYATAITPGALHRGRFYHVHFKPLYEAIGEANNRHRKAASLGRFVERLMLLDAVLTDHRCGWLGTEQDKRTYFREALERELPDDWYPHLTSHNGTEKTTRFFPDKMPIGVPVKGERRHVFLYLATREIPMDFRGFLLRHADLLKAVDEWTIRVLMPRRLRRAATLYRYAVRDAFLMPLEPREVRELDHRPDLAGEQRDHLIEAVRHPIPQAVNNDWTDSYLGRRGAQHLPTGERPQQMRGNERNLAALEIRAQFSG